MRVTERLSGSIVIGLTAAIGVWQFIVPRFGGHPSAPDGLDYFNHTALVAAALDTIKETRGLPISTDEIIPGVEYPYFLFGNFAFSVVSAFASYATGTPAYVGVATVLAASFVAGVAGVYLIARQHGIKPFLSAITAYLYAAGPYLSLNLLVRDAYPEYMMWQFLPFMYLLLQRSLRHDAGPWWLLVGSVTLAAPFYVHKLVAPYVILTMLALVFYRYKPDVRLVVRIGIIGCISLLLSVPAWSPMRGITIPAEELRGPRVINTDLVNYLWPYLLNSLEAQDGAANYRYQFGLQVGLVPFTGFLLGVVSLAACRSADHVRRVCIVTGLFALYTILTIGAFDVWDSEYVPLPMRAIQFTYRLLGLAYFVGFLALFTALSVLGRPWRSVIPWRAGVALQVLVVAVAMLSVSTYWHDPVYTGLPAASITPAHLVDFGRFYLPPTHGNLDVDRAVAGDDWLVVPPSTVAIDSPARRRHPHGQRGPTSLDELARAADGPHLRVHDRAAGRDCPSLGPARLPGRTVARPR